MEEVAFELGIKGLYCVGQKVCSGFSVTSYEKNPKERFGHPNITSMGKIRKGHSRKRKEPVRLLLSVNTLKAAVPTSQASSAGTS